MRKLVVDIISALLILLFVYAALSKLLEFETFRFQLQKSPYVKDMANILVWTVPTTEIVISLALAIQRYRHIGMYAAFFLMLLFTGYIYTILHFSYYVPCSCGGVLSEMSWNEHLLFNIVFTLLALVGILLTGTVRTKSDAQLNAA